MILYSVQLLLSNRMKYDYHNKDGIEFISHYRSSSFASDKKVNNNAKYVDYIKMKRKNKCYIHKSIIIELLLKLYT